LSLATISPAVAPGGLGKSTTPVDHGPTEPPGRRPPAPGPQLRSPGGSRISSRSPSIPTGLSFTLTVPDSVEPRCESSSVATPDELRFAHHPCRLRPRQCPLAAVLLRQVLNVYELPRRRPDFLEDQPRFPPAHPFPSRFPDSVEPMLRLLSRNAGWLRFATTPAHFGRTEPPGRLPTCARLPYALLGRLCHSTSR